MSIAMRNELLLRGLSDMLQLDEIASVARRRLGGTAGEPDVMQATTETIGELMNAGYAIVGDVAKNGGRLCVRPWGLNTEETVKRIEDDWRGLGRPPNIGEVCWLELTDAGRDEALAVES